MSFAVEATRIAGCWLVEMTSEKMVLVVVAASPSRSARTSLAHHDDVTTADGEKREKDETEVRNSTNST